MVLELYLEDKVLAPVSGTYVGWTRWLLDVFQVSPEIDSMGNALETRFSPSALPETIRNVGNLISMTDEISYRSREGSTVSFLLHHSVERTTVPPLPEHLVRRSASTCLSNQTWLVIARHDLSLHWRSGISNRHLYNGLQTIVAGCGTVAALAPTHIRVGDWFLASGSGFYPTKDSIGLIIRLVSVSIPLCNRTQTS
jgi:hypothetical protein